MNPGVEKLSAYLEARIGSGWRDLAANPKLEDVDLTTVYKTRYVQCDLVVAGQRTLNDFPVAAFYPVHLRKTVVDRGSGRSEYDAYKEWERTSEARNQLGDQVPYPIGMTQNTFRVEIVPGKALNELSPFQGLDTNSPKAVEVLDRVSARSPERALALFRGLEQAAHQVREMHGKGYAHRDLHSQNLMFVESGQEMKPVLIDFETFGKLSDFSPMEQRACAMEDFKAIFREGRMLQGILGKQPGKFAEACYRFENLLTPQTLSTIREYESRSRERHISVSSQDVVLAR